jgi:RNA recognition motif-containing protein
MARKLYVGNLPFQAGEAELHDLFGRLGTVESIHVVTDQMTGRPRGFAFVEMGSEAEAQAAIQALHDTELAGRRLTVNEARPKFDGGGGRPGGGGRGGGFGSGRGPRRGEPRW